MFEFRDDDEGYAEWLATHPDGFVINILSSHSPAGARIHRARCRWITSQVLRGVALTKQYVKGCADDLDELAQWPSEHVRQQILQCPTCARAPEGLPFFANKSPRPIPSAPQEEGQWEVDGPTEDNGIVQAWSENYIRFERRPPWQDSLRNEIKRRCRQIEPSDDQVLHATFIGDKPSNADVENLVLYNIDPFRVAGRNGIRFEHGAMMPTAPSSFDYPFAYRYATAPRSDTFSDWEPVRTLAVFDWIALDAFDGQKKLAKVWLSVSRALARGDVEAFHSSSTNAPFALRLQLRPPRGPRPVWGNLVKEVFDGVICAFQAHTDTDNLDAVVERLHSYLPADFDEIRRLLLDQKRAILGAVPRLVYSYGAGVKWDPSDHCCVAGELLAAESNSSTDWGWAIKGDLTELSRRNPT